MDNKKRLALAVALLQLTGCNLFDTTDSENIVGRGPAAFDPYSSSQSGAIALGLTWFKGCSLLATGVAVAPGAANIPYPTDCPSVLSGIPTNYDADPAFDYTLPVEPPSGRFEVMAGQAYFLSRLAFADTDYNPLNLGDYNAAANWMRGQSALAGLDWSNMTVNQEIWTRGVNTYQVFDREIAFTASWMESLDDTFLVEVLDQDGEVRGSTTYDRREFFGEGGTANHTRASWLELNLGKPAFPGDTNRYPLPGDQGFELLPTSIKVVRAEFSGSTNPFHSFTMPNITGDGAIRVTWSQLPNAPFHFPVSFVERSELPETCYRLDANGLPTDEAVACSFGINQTAKFSPPANGTHYVPGETFDMVLTITDENGNAIHKADRMPSVNSVLGNTANGMLYTSLPMTNVLREAGWTESGFRVSGPLQNFGYTTDTYAPAYFQYPRLELHQYSEVLGLAALLPGAYDAEYPTRYPVTVPADADPGTYQLVMKGHRQFLGERVNKMQTFNFQVGQPDATVAPNRVGNCQICHRGVLSMENVMHGAAVDDIATCKTCHDLEFTNTIHRVHMNSQKYEQSKADCTICHLTRESATRPTYTACESCHSKPHGAEYFTVGFGEPSEVPNGRSNCANTCHVDKTPTTHILPAEGR